MHARSLCRVFIYCRKGWLPACKISMSGVHSLQERVAACMQDLYAGCSFTAGKGGCMHARSLCRVFIHRRKEWLRACKISMPGVHSPQERVAACMQDLYAGCSFTAGKSGCRMVQTHFYACLSMCWLTLQIRACARCAASVTSRSGLG